MSNTPADQGSAAVKADDTQRDRERAFRKAAADTATYAIDNLLEILNDSRAYLIGGNDLAAWGTLLMFDDHAADLNAAIRLHRSANRRAP
jgi:hypothetical protein